MPGPTGDDDDVERRAFLNSNGRNQHKPAVGAHGIECLRYNMHDRVRKPGKDFEGFREIDLRHRRKQQQPDMTRRGNN